MRGSNSGGGEIFRIRPDRPWDWAWRWPLTPSSAEVKERVQLYIYSPSGPSWPYVCVCVCVCVTTNKVIELQSGTRQRQITCLRGFICYEFQVFVGTVVLKESCNNKLTHNNCIFIFKYMCCTIINYLKVHPRTDNEGPEGEYIYIALLFLWPRCKMVVGYQRHAPTALRQERPATHCKGGWVGPSVGLDGAFWQKLDLILNYKRHTWQLTDRLSVYRLELQRLLS